ncbi:MAG: radical SAM protein [Thermodesulfobacteriota bacterium]
MERIPFNAGHLWSTQKPILTHLDIELTHRCNNNCMHCCINVPAGDSVALENELATSELHRILKEAAKLGALQVRFTGGEPLLRSDFEELYLFARRLGMKVLLFTNGRLITERLADLFAHIPPLMPIEITVYGMHTESYEAVSGVRGSFAEFRRGIQFLRERGVPFVVKGVHLPPNRGEMEEFESWSTSIPWMDCPPSYAVLLEKRSKHDDPVKDRRIEALRPSPEDVVAMTRKGRRYREEMTEFCRNFLGPPGDKLFGCGAGTSGCLDPYGRFQACLSLRTPELAYDIKNGTLMDALTVAFPNLRKMRAANPEYLHRCGRCFIIGLCEQCPARSWNETRTLDTPLEYFCSIAHAEARELGLLRGHEHAWEVRDWQFRIDKALS